MNKKQHPKPPIVHAPDPCPKWAKPSFWILSALVLAALLYVAPQVGINADEGEIDGTHGKYCLKYYTDGDTTFANYPQSGVMQALQPDEPIYLFQKYFGVGFEIVPAIALKYMGLPPQYEFEFRHLLCALLGWLLMVCTGLLGRELRDWRLGIMCLLMVACTPTIFGWSTQDAKDTPFAAGFALAVLAFVRMLKTFPRIRIIDGVAAAAGIALAVSIRIGGLILPMYAAVGMALALMFRNNAPRPSAQGSNNAAMYIAPLVYGFFIYTTGVFVGLCFYPNFFYAGPVEHIRGALSFVHNHPLSVLMTWDGKFVTSTALPPFYLWKAYAITMPPFIFIGLLLWFFNGITAMGKGCRHINCRSTFFVLNLFLLFTIIFPIAYLLATKSPIYQGWKHTMFVYTAVVVFAAMGFYDSRRWLGKILGGARSGGVVV
jgi:hypothetical protein